MLPACSGVGVEPTQLATTVASDHRFSQLFSSDLATLAPGKPGTRSGYRPCAQAAPGACLGPERFPGPSCGPRAPAAGALPRPELRTEARAAERRWEPRPRTTRPGFGSVKGSCLACSSVPALAGALREAAGRCVSPVSLTSMFPSLCPPCRST